MFHSRESVVHDATLDQLGAPLFRDPQPVLDGRSSLRSPGARRLRLLSGSARAGARGPRGFERGDLDHEESIHQKVVSCPDPIRRPHPSTGPFPAPACASPRIVPMDCLLRASRVAARSSLCAPHVRAAAAPARGPTTYVAGMAAGATVALCIGVPLLISSRSSRGTSGTPLRAASHGARGTSVSVAHPRPVLGAKLLRAVRPSLAAHSVHRGRGPASEHSTSPFKARPTPAPRPRRTAAASTGSRPRARASPRSPRLPTSARPVRRPRSAD